MDEERVEERLCTISGGITLWRETSFRRVRYGLSADFSQEFIPLSRGDAKRLRDELTRLLRGKALSDEP